MVHKCQVLSSFQGVLDLLANRCLAQGTNAWTDVDHTCYTVMTAGSEGFLNLLPIYLDHILYPTLTVSRPGCDVLSRLRLSLLECEGGVPVFLRMQPS